ncbi:Metallo-peptidase family M12 [Rubritalea squalenifaciens DSM 18772]|uniref:Metallo-peptidase family M12 n=1 Tax=Rubritalea squalenifaciens DSM 18772 TaxID=1123071 RepID=A0A1M6SW04_9BACT|nr:cadherin domain-containing protein [Rubritalea squalenifaciens]SHK48895.1 Metallo-peptidase family M12 [Rubritalea squalenifaciens DSM 18772]
MTRKPSIAAYALASLMVSGAHVCAAAPDTLTQIVSHGGETITLQLKKEPIRGAEFEVLVQNSTGGYDVYNPVEERSYLGTVAEYPDAVACGVLLDNGSFKGAVYFDRGGTWFTLGSSVIGTRGIGEQSFTFPSGGDLQPGRQDGAEMYEFDVAFDADYKYYTQRGSSVASVVETIEYSLSNTRAMYMRDTLLKPKAGRIIIRADEAQNPYTDDFSLSSVRSEWRASNQSVNRDVVCAIKPGIGGGVAWVGTIGTGNGYSINGTSGDGSFDVVWRHELGHNWSLGHFVGGNPEGKAIMGGNQVGRLSGPEVNGILNHRDSRLHLLDGIGTYAAVNLPPYAALDPVEVEIEAGRVESVTIDALANDFDANGHAISIKSFQAKSNLGYPVSLSVGTGTDGQDELVYSALGGSGFDYFSYTIEDSSGQTATGYVFINSKEKPVSLWALETDADVIAQVGSSTNYGSEEFLFLKNFGASSSYTRLGWIHFNVSDKSYGDTAEIEFTMGDHVSTAGYVDVWGVVDGVNGDHLGVDWTEDGLTGSNAPISFSEVGGAQTTYLGRIELAGGGSSHKLATPELLEFLKADNNGEVTILLVREEGQQSNFSFSTKEDLDGSGAVLRTYYANNDQKVADAFVRSGYYANSNYGDETRLILKKDSGSYAREAYLRFDQTVASNYADPRSFLSLTPMSLQPSQIIRIRAVADSGDSWGEKEITWNTRPIGSGAGMTLNANDLQVNVPVLIDVTDLINEVGNDNGAITFHIDAQVLIASGGNSFASREHPVAEYRPKFYVVGDETTDTDGDGFADYFEMEQGTDPTDALDVPSTRLAALWKFDKNLAGDAAVADVISGAAADYVGGAGLSADTLGRSGQAGDKALDLGTAGNGKYITVEDVAFLQQAAGDGKLTISFWQKLNQTGKYMSSFWALSPTSGSNNRGMQAHTPWSNGIIYFDAGGTSSVNRVSGGAPAGTDWTAWNHFALVKDGDVSEIWMNGEVVASASGKSDLVTDFAKLIIGANSGGGDSVSGMLDDFAVFNTALNSGQITALAGGVDPVAVGISTAPVVADATFTVAENTPAGASLGAVTASDSDLGDTLSYSIIEGNEGGEFAIDAATGEITTLVSFDYETVSSYILTVEVVDTTDHVATATVTVAVGNIINDDSDADGLIDEWEVENFGSVAATNGTEDSDVDGLSNASEQSNATDPNNADSDFDGYSDNVELVNGTDPSDDQSVPAMAPYVYWTLDDASGDTATDASGWLNDGQLVNGTAWTASAVKGGGASFDGVDDRVNLNLTPSNIGPFTVMMWVKSGADGQSPYSSAFANAGLSENATFQIDRTNGFTYRGSSVASFGAAPLNEWVHLAVVSDGTDTKLYYNGQLSKTLTGVSDDYFGAMRLGANRNEDRMFEGEIDEFYLFEQALEQQDIISISGQQFTPEISDATFSVAEDISVGSLVGTVAATDLNSSDTLSYEIVSGAEGKFTIDASTGEISTIAGLDYETAISYVLTVTAADNGGLSATAEVTVDVTNITSGDDSDQDGLEDDWEVENFGSVTVAVGDEDSDGDGLSNASEQVTGTNPTDADSDGDGYSDNVELVNGTDASDAQSVPAMAPLIYWSLDDAEGDTAMDSSGWLHDGALINDTEWTTNGVKGGGVSFDGAGDRISVNLEPAKIGAYTVMLWAKSGANGQYAYKGVFASNHGSSGGTFQIDRSNGFSYRGSVLRSFGPAPLNEWVHLAVVCDGTDTKLYNNGQLVHTLEGVCDDFFGEVRLGSNRGLNYFFKGEVDEFYLFDQDLSQQDIVELAGVQMAPELGDASFSIIENSEAGSLIGAVVATDLNVSDVASYAIAAGNEAGKFSIDASTGEITLVGELDYESATHYALTVEAKDTTGLTDSATVSINVTNQNEVPAIAGFSVNISEDAAVGTSLGAVVGADPDVGDALTYKIVSGGNGAFAIDSDTGEVTTVAGLDYETETGYTLTVKVTDAGGLSATADVAVNVTNVTTGDDSDLDGLEDDWEVASYGSTTATAGDGDLDADGLTDLEELALGSDPASGDSDGDGFADILETVLGTDLVDAADQPDSTFEGLHAWWNLNDLAGADKAIDNSGNSFHANVSDITFNGSEASFDGENDFLNAGPDAAILGKTDYTVSVWMKTAADFDSKGVLVQQRDPGSVGYLGEYMLNVNADGRVNYFIYDYGYQVNLTTTQTVNDGEWHHIMAVRNGDQVTVYIDGAVAAQGSGPIKTLKARSVVIGYDHRDNKHHFKGVIDDVRIYDRAVDIVEYNEAPVAGDAVYTVDENLLAGAAVGSAIATDANKGNVLSYSIVGGNEGGEFQIDSVTGEISTTGSFDYESASEYLLTVEVSDGYVSDTASVEIYVNDVNDAPVAEAAEATLVEGAAVGSMVATVGASDQDTGAVLSYEITGGNDGAFTIDSATGEITTAAPLDFESASQHVLTVTVSDGELSDTATVTIDVTDVNEAPVIADASGVVSEDVEIGTYVATVAATDQDAGDSVSYAITGGNDGSFAIDSATGVISTVAELDYETIPAYELEVTASDAAGLTDTAIVSVEIIDVVFEDHDGDTMDDAWEIANFGGVEVSDGFGDADDDGLSDADEHLAGSNPNSKDTDGDGFADVLEFTVGTELADATSKPDSTFAGLVAWWNLEDAAGAISATDNSGSAIHGFVDGVTFTGQEASFNGKDDFIATEVGLLNDMAAFTISGWYRSPLEKAPNAGIWGQSGVVEFGINGTSLRVWTSGGGSTQVKLPEPGVWHHVIVVADGEGLKLYVDGVLSASNSKSTGNYGSSSTSFNIGGGGIWHKKNDWFTGDIKDVRVYDRAVDITEFYPLGKDAE